MDASNHFFQENVKYFFVPKISFNTFHSDKTRSHKHDNAFVIPAISFDCATHQNYSQLFYTCLRRKIGSRRCGVFCIS